MHVHKLIALALAMGFAGTALAQDNPAQIELAGGKLELKAPESWVRKAPQTRIVEHEFAIPAAEGDPADGRFTIMAAGGSVDANIDRWYAQFSQPDGGSTKEKSKVKKTTASGLNVHLVDMGGTYKDQRGPVAPAVERPNYRMIAAIIETGGAGNYFLKFYGPEKTVAANEKAFVEMVEGLQKK